MTTTVIYYFKGKSLAKTEKAILLHDEKTNLKAWLPVSVAYHLKWLGNFRVELGVPGWYVNKIKWS
jgi:hypothetical protein